MPNFSSLCLIPIFFLITSLTNAADVFQTDSISISSNGPIANLFTLARPDILQNHPVHSKTISTQFELTNYISSTVKSSDQLYIDGETWTYRSSVHYQLSPDVIITASIPWIKHSGGTADSFIYSFHEILHLPQNGRRQNNENDIRWILNRDGETLVDVADNLSGWGDLSITTQLTPESSPSVRWTFMTKLPTGEYKNQTGSNRIDLGLGFAEMNPKWFKDRSSLPDWNLSFWYGASLSYLGTVKALKPLDQNPFAISLRTGLAYSYIPSWHLKCQFDMQSPLFKTDIRELGWIPVQVSLSTKHYFSQDTSFEFVIIEDIRPRSVPDVVFQTTLETTF